ncbi:Oligopeptide transporter 8 [Vitis vinifera]|uniref:Oligopeptide transporter 8 n=1 Tax=Vitis vinifera TaxID=29760 RepID=A0A438FDR6_VITVI|nr:Oligopeptide transporter 8 [Vitis vinifera]
MASLEIDGSRRSKSVEEIDEYELSPIEEVRLTVPTTDDPSLPVWTFRMWFLGLISCVLLSFLNTFFGYRTEPLVITMISVQVATLPVGRFMAKVLPKTKFRVPGFGSREYSLNPGPFNVKEHVLISIFANAGAHLGVERLMLLVLWISLSFLPQRDLFLGLLDSCDHNPGLAQVLGYGWAGILRKFVVDPAEMWWPSSLTPSFFIQRASRERQEADDKSEILLNRTHLQLLLVCGSRVPLPYLGTISWVCWVFPNSITAQQIGPLITPFFAIINVLAGYVIFMYLITPVAYWGLNVYNAKNFPIFSSHLFNAQGQRYNVSAIVNNKFEIDMETYQKQGHIHLSIFFSISYGLGFAAVISTLTHVALFNGSIPSIDIHPSNQHHNCYNKSEYLMGVILPGRPIANVCFKTYGYISMAQAVSFLNDFKLGHYMKIPPRSMFVVQFIGTIIAGTVNITVAWWLLTSIENICQDQLLPPNSPWTCPGDRVFYDASVIWGLVGPRRIFGDLGDYSALTGSFSLAHWDQCWFGWLHKAFPTQKWISLVNPPQYFSIPKELVQRYNYVLSAALDAGLAFMGVLLYFSTDHGEQKYILVGCGSSCKLTSESENKGSCAPALAHLHYFLTSGAVAGGVRVESKKQKISYKFSITVTGGCTVVRIKASVV